jgi:hypothetical protein
VKLKIISNNSEKIIDFFELSKYLEDCCEVYSIGSDGDLYLGVISHKASVYLSCEFAEYALRNYHKKPSEKIQFCIDLIRKWIEDKDSVSNEELLSAAEACYRAGGVEIHPSNPDDYSICAATYSAAYHAAKAYSCSLYDAAYHAADCAADRVGYEMELLRQSQFILDYLKSGLYLFHLEK